VQLTSNEFPEFHGYLNALILNHLFLNFILTEIKYEEKLFCSYIFHTVRRVSLSKNKSVKSRRAFYYANIYLLTIVAATRMLSGDTSVFAVSSYINPESDNVV